MPVWSKRVLKNLELKEPSRNSKERVEESIRFYDEICDSYKAILKSDDAKKWIDLFDKKYPDADISEVKKIDLILWQIRDE